MLPPDAGADRGESADVRGDKLLSCPCCAASLHQFFRAKQDGQLRNPFSEFLPRAVLFNGQLDITAGGDIFDSAVAEGIAEFGQGRVMADEQGFAYGLIQCPAPGKEDLLVKGEQLARSLPAKITLQGFANAFNGCLGPEGWAGEDILKRTARLGNMLGHEAAGPLAAFVQRAVHIGQGAVFPAGLCVSEQMDFLHSLVLEVKGGLITGYHRANGVHDVLVILG